MQNFLRKLFLATSFIATFIIVFGFDVSWLSGSDRVEYLDYQKNFVKAPTVREIMPVASLVDNASAYLKQAGDDFADAKQPVKVGTKIFSNQKWQDGIAAFADKDMVVAELNFSQILSEENLSPADKSAVAFWAYRAKLDSDREAAHKYIEIAAGEIPSFYSILARHIIGRESLEAAAKMRIAFQYANGKNDVAKNAYPMPNWQPSVGYKVDPALIFAIVRKESGFNPNAKSSGGAIGLMQLMPATANDMARNMRLSGQHIKPAINMSLGQNYVQRLMQDSAIGNNLIFLTAAYNAGPNAVKKWQDELAYNDDPLLFIESIPYGRTRDYVVSVIGNYWVYSELFGGSNESLAEIANNKWAHYSQNIAAQSEKLGLN